MSAADRQHATAPAAPAAPGKPRSMLTLWLLLAVCATPLLAALAVYLFGLPTSRMNYGELIEPRALTEASATRLDGGTLRLADLKGKWTMVQADSAACPAACRDKLYSSPRARTWTGCSGCGSSPTRAPWTRKC
jgi:hypothetical protein